MFTEEQEMIVSRHEYLESFIRSPFSAGTVDDSVRTSDAIYVAENFKSPDTPLHGMSSHYQDWL